MSVTVNKKTILPLGKGVLSKLSKKVTQAGKCIQKYGTEEKANNCKSGCG
jgi:hypothetical protein